VAAQQAPAPLRLPPVPQSSARARRFIRDTLRSLGLDSLVEAAELGISELVTNACVHARSEITVAVNMARAGMVRIEVSDDSPRPPRRTDLGPLATGGRGLQLLSAYGRWGVQPGNGRPGKTVWFEPSGQIRR
jgi:anti-sigma regulatory factor (Ser/Thr protein kinase)